MKCTDTDIVLQLVLPFLRLVERRSAEVGDGDACAGVQCQQENQPSSARLQTVCKQLPSTDRDPGEVNFTPAHTQTIRIQAMQPACRKKPLHQEIISILGATNARDRKIPPPSLWFLTFSIRNNIGSGFIVVTMLLLWRCIFENSTKKIYIYIVRMSKHTCTFQCTGNTQQHFYEDLHSQTLLGFAAFLGTQLHLQNVWTVKEPV